MELDKEKLAPARATAKYDKKELTSEELLKYALVFAHKGITATIKYSNLKNQHKIPQQNSQTETNLQNYSKAG